MLDTVRGNPTQMFTLFRQTVRLVVLIFGFVSLGFTLPCSGTVSVYNICLGHVSYYRRWTLLLRFSLSEILSPSQNLHGGFSRAEARTPPSPGAAWLPLPAFGSRAAAGALTKPSGVSPFAEASPQGIPHASITRNPMPGPLSAQHSSQKPRQSSSSHFKDPNSSLSSTPRDHLQAETRIITGGARLAS